MTTTRTHRSKKADPATGLEGQQQGEQQQPELEDGEEEEKRDQRLPPRILIDVHPSAIEVPGAEHIERDAARMMKSIDTLGLIESPSVEMLPWTPDQQILYRVVVGRRRVLACQLLAKKKPTRWQSIQVQVFTAGLSDEQKALAILGENNNRGNNWLAELEAITDLVSARIGMLEKAISQEYGIPAVKLGFYLKLAQFPPRLLSDILAGSVTQVQARALTGLSHSRLEELAAIVEEGIPLTDELIADSRKVTLSQSIDPIFSSTMTVDSPIGTPMQENRDVVGLAAVGINETNKVIPENQGGLATVSGALEMLTWLKRKFPKLALLITALEQAVSAEMKSRKK